MWQGLCQKVTAFLQCYFLQFLRGQHFVGAHRFPADFVAVKLSGGKSIAPALLVGLKQIFQFFEEPFFQLPLVDLPTALGKRFWTEALSFWHNGIFFFPNFSLLFFFVCARNTIKSNKNRFNWINSIQLGVPYFAIFIPTTMMMTYVSAAAFLQNDYVVEKIIKRIHKYCFG